MAGDAVDPVAPSQHGLSTRDQTSVVLSADAAALKLLRMWVMHCPFRRTGSPVLGTFGARTEPVVIMTAETWKQLCDRVPALQTMEFEVGTYE